MLRPSRPVRLVIPVAFVMALLTACGSTSSSPPASVAGSSAATAESTAASTIGSSASASAAANAATPVSAAAMPPAVRNASTSAAAPVTSSAPAAGATLPLSYSTGAASEVITVVAASTSSTTATVQAWDKTAAGWVTHGAAISAYVGSAGLTTHPSESVSATPIGSFGLTQAFGSLANPGTAIPYHQTTSADWWISQPGPLYNTMQTCSSGCSFTLGDPNEHLAAITPEYRYAVVIDYNTTAPIVQGAGSAFFLHVANGAPTAGCVAIAQANLVSIMQWLNPADSPRILIGVS